MSEEHCAASQLWSKACDTIKAKLPEHVFARWFKPVIPIRMEEKKIILGVSDEIFAQWLEANYKNELQDAFASIDSKITYVLETGHIKQEEPAQVQLTAQTAAVNHFADPAPSAEKIVAPNCLADYTFDNFIVGEENRYAYSAAQTAAYEPGKFNPLYIYGSTGMGKTHLIQAVANQVQNANPNAVVRYITCEAFLNSYLDSLHTHTMFKSHLEFRNYFREVDILLVDDVHQLGGKDQLQEEFFNTFNALYNSGKQIILTSDKQPSEIRGLESRLVTRFESGVTTQITSPTTFETRLSILQHEQDEQLVKLSPDVIHYVAEKISSSIRTLKGALMRLVAYSSMLGGASLPMSKAEEILSDMLDKEAETRKVTVNRIQQVVAEHFQLRITDLTGSKRPKNIAEPRMMAMYLAREMTELSLIDIGNAFGGRNHATVIHACEQVRKVSEKDDDFRRNLAGIKRKLQG